MIDDVIAISGPCKSQIFNLQKISAVIPQTTAKRLLISFLALSSHSCVANWSNSAIKNFQDIRKVHGKIVITSSSRDRPLPEKNDAKHRLSIPGPSPKKLVAEIHRLKENRP